MSMINRQVFNNYFLLPGRCVVCGAVCSRSVMVCTCCGRMMLQSRIPYEYPAGGVLPYRPWGEVLVRALKFGRRPGIAAFLAQLIAAGVPRPEADCLTWVPLHPGRRRKRGYDQSRLIAGYLGEIWGIRCVGVLRRLRRTSPQARSGANFRHSNVAGAFAARPGGGRVVVVDDVVTTGATMSACSGALRKAGWRQVKGIAAFMG